MLMSQYIHIQKRINHTPRKLRLVADMVRNMPPAQALQVLRFTNKAAALDLAKAIKTALFNTKSASDTLLINRLEVNQESTRTKKRFRASARGRASKYVKRTSQVRIVLVEPDKKIKEVTEEEKSK